MEEAVRSRADTMILSRAKHIVRMLRSARLGGTSPARAAVRYAFHRAAGRHIWAHQRAVIIGAHNITTIGLLEVGINSGFNSQWESTTVRVKGQLTFRGPYSIGRWCRIDIGDNGEVVFGRGYVSPSTTFVAMNRILVGEDTAIAWGCTIFDSDFHQLSYQGRRPKGDSVNIGNRVWVGCNVTIMPGSSIPDGCVVGAGSVVLGKFDEPNTLIVGNPARVVRSDVAWA